jgi:hypothetical protein
MVRNFTRVGMLLVLLAGLVFGGAASADNPFFEGPSGAAVGTGWHGPFVLAGEDGVLYLVDGSGDLRWYQNSERYEESYVDGSGSVVGNGWDQVYVLGGKDGVFYVVDDDGNLRWYKRGPGSSIDSWVSEDYLGTVIGTGWKLDRVFGGHDGIIYGVEDDTLYRYEYIGDPTTDPVDPADPETQWAGPREKVGQGGWMDFVHLTASGNRIFAVDTAADLWVYDIFDEKFQGFVIGKGWNGFSRIVAAPGGYIYGQWQDGTLYSYGVAKNPSAGDMGSLVSRLEVEGSIPAAQRSLDLFDGILTSDLEQRACLIQKFPSDGCSGKKEIDADLQKSLDFLGIPLKADVNKEHWDSIFLPACAEHDLCYGTTQLTKAQCDKQFLEQLNSLCQIGDNAFDPTCKGGALAYHAAVVLKGDGSYGGNKSAREKGCWYP